MTNILIVNNMHNNVDHVSDIDILMYDMIMC